MPAIQAIAPSVAPQPALLPRIIRAKDAAAYLGMCRNEFNRSVRPNIREFRIGTQGVGFDRKELDAWADSYLSPSAIENPGAEGNNQPRSERQGKQELPWPERQSRASRSSRTASGRSTKSTKENEFKRALELVKGKKRSNT